ncbi:hypothetical protein Patl1_19119 [Pistacia atlantica]|uniref:Uncharacterized protein n=1 Tax=Pistacia atlantica TaxID=434234 RepID=A0ACC1C0D2_9ROSI|nr:hypothetical protein Patl1_19119 [Pistacia atlantica]
MSSVSALSTRENREHNGSSLADNGEVSDTKANVSPEAEANQRALLVEWLNSILPHLNLPIKASDEELKACLIDGTLLSQILKKLRLVSYKEVGDFNHSSVSSSENVRRFLETMDKLGISGFAMSDLEKACKSACPCIQLFICFSISALNLAGLYEACYRLSFKTRAEFSPTKENFSVNSTITKSGNSEKDASSGGPLPPVFGEERRKVLSESQFRGASRSSC